MYEHQTTGCGGDTAMRRQYSAPSAEIGIQAWRWLFIVMIIASFQVPLGFVLSRAAYAGDIFNKIEAEQVSDIDILLLKQRLKIVENRRTDNLPRDLDSVDVFFDKRKRAFILDVTRTALELPSEQCKRIAEYYSDSVYGKPRDRNTDFTNFIGSNVFQNSANDRSVSDMNDLLNHTIINISNNHSTGSCSLNVGSRRFIYRGQEDGLDD